jgi:hypothetical protein
VKLNSIGNFMRRNFIGWFLLVPLLMNGLWFVCEGAPVQAAAQSQEQSEEAADCVRICVMKHRAVNAGPMCLILPGNPKTSVTVLDFGVAILTPEVHLQPATAAEEFVMVLDPSYSNPNTANYTPPPRS